jgi:formylglycine-generating enzyme required for sulfatase activity
LNSRPALLVPIFFLVYLAAGCQKAPKDMVLVPGGEFIMGTDETDPDEKAAEYGIGKPWLIDEHPAHKVNLPAYYIDKYEVTNARYKQFVEATGRKAPADWSNGQIPQGRSLYPVEMVNWDDAAAFCRWDGKRLPTEAEWEKAARGTDGRIYPWGNEFDPKKANVGGSAGGTVAVGSYESGKSPYGVHDLIGNVWEWTSDWYEGYKGSTYKSNDYGNKFKVIRGNSWPTIGHFSPEAQMEIAGHHSTATFRLYFTTDGAVNDVGFRCAKSA